MEGCVEVTACPGRPGASRSPDSSPECYLVPVVSQGESGVGAAKEERGKNKQQPKVAGFVPPANRHATLHCPCG